MKKNVIKTVIAAVCVVTAGMGGFKAYNVGNQSEAYMLFAENVEALSVDEQQDQNDCSDPSSDDCTYTDSEGNVCKRAGYTKSKTTN